MSTSTVIGLLSILFLATALTHPARANQVGVIELTSPEEIQDASVMDRAIGDLGSKVMECVQGKLAPADRCFCRYPQQFSEVRKTYEQMLRQHPEWKGKAVSYASEGRSHLVSFAALSRQFETKCP
jgi:hypothetical protein